jgi:LmbE family N-acetylglucosaminyl deacetylase
MTGHRIRRAGHRAGGARPGLASVVRENSAACRRSWRQNGARRVERGSARRGRAQGDARQGSTRSASPRRRAHARAVVGACGLGSPGPRARAARRGAHRRHRHPRRGGPRSRAGRAPRRPGGAVRRHRRPARPVRRRPTAGGRRPVLLGSGLGESARRDLGRARRGELASALRVQGLSAVPVHWLGLPDSGLHEHADGLREALTPLLAGADAYLAPWPLDPHPDHRAAGLAAAAAAPVTAHGWSYPIWMWAWVDADDPFVPWQRARAVPLDEVARTVRRRAVDCFTSQVGPGPDGSPPVLAAGLLEHVGAASTCCSGNRAPTRPRWSGSPRSRPTATTRGTPVPGTSGASAP